MPLGRPVKEKAGLVKKVLVVDDDAVIRAVLNYRLKGENYAVSLAVDGLDALRQISEDDFDLIILDLLLPKKDGLKVLQRIKNDPRTSDIPVIVLSALSGSSYCDRATMSGADRYFAKPFSLHRLVAEVRGFIGSGVPEAAISPDVVPVWEENYR